jgi:molybdopterin converting factor small subunit
MEIKLRLFGDLRKYLPGLAIGEEYPLVIESGATVKDVLLKSGIPLDRIKIIIVEGRAKSLEYVLNDSERLSIFPPIAGG